MERQVVNAVDAGDGDLELRQLRAKLEADPASLSARLELASAYKMRGFPEIALEHLRLACERAPESVEAHIELAKALRAEQRPEEGAKLLTVFLATHDAAADAWAWKGLLQDDAGDHTGAEAANRKAVSLHPERDDFHNNLGYSLLEQGRKTDAAEEFREALRLNPQSVIARNNLGLALAEDPKEAVVHLQSVTDPATAHNNLAVALMEQGRYAEARKEIGVALSYNRQHSAALRNLDLISRLDGGSASVELPERKSFWSKLRHSWRRMWGGSGNAETAGNQQKTDRPGNDRQATVAAQ